MALMSSSHRARGLPLFLAPPPIPNIIDFSKLFSLRMMCQNMIVVVSLLVLLVGW